MPKKVLLVDDEPAIVRIAQMNLKRGGYEVVTAADGREALEKIAAERPDIIVLDIMMPHMDGFEVLHRLKANPETRSIPVIMLTARSKDEDILYSEKAGAEHYLTKPFHPQELITVIGRVLERADGKSG